MGFRITTNMMMNTYMFNLQNSTKKLSDARDQVLTQRKFGSYAEDPAAATLAFRLRRDFSQTINYLNNTKDVYSKFNTAWHNLAGVVEDLSDATARMASIRGNNGTAGESRTALAIVLRETADSVVGALNQKLGDHFVFAGNDALNAPFSWSSDGKLLYRGVDVNSGSVQKPTTQDPGWLRAVDQVKLNAQQNKVIDADANMQNWYQGVQPGGTRVAATGDTLSWLQKFRDEDVKNGKMTASEAAAWYDYYTDPSKPLPTDSKGNALKEPDWPDQMNKLTEWDQDASADERDWYNYYMGISDEKPNSTEPTWLNDAKNDTTAEWIAAGRAPDEVGEELDQWLAYYKRETTEKPLLAQSGDVKGWGTVDPEDPMAYPEGLPETDEGLDEDDKKWFNYYNDKREYAKLQAMANEEMYIDLGMGAAESSPNNPVKGTYFNSALSGIDYLGYGVDKDGDPKNLSLIMKELADVFETWDEDTQSYNPALAKNTAEGLTSGELEAKAYRLMDKLKAGQEHTTEKWVELDAKSVYLQTSESRLSDQATNLNMQILDVEQVDLAEAITNFSWEQYCYNAALKIGNQLLSQSLIDYMN